MKFASWTDLIEAFREKYPGGTIEKGGYYMATKVQFTPGGKTYFYKGGALTVMEKLGLTA